MPFWCEYFTRYCTLSVAWVGLVIRYRGSTLVAHDTNASPQQRTWVSRVGPAVVDGLDEALPSAAVRQVEARQVLLLAAGRALRP